MYVFRRQWYVYRTAKQPTEAAKHTKTLKSNRTTLETPIHTGTREHSQSHTQTPPDKWPPEICTTNTRKYAVQNTQHTQQSQKQIAGERG